MKPAIKLSINQPCHENWQNMLPSKRGRFCNACAKEVIDFTTMSDTEVLYYFLDRKKENVCGRLYEDQVNREITKPVYPQKKKFWYLNYFAMAFVFLFKGNSSKGQDIKKLEASVLAVKQQTQNSDKQLSARVGGVSVGVNIAVSNKMNVSGNITDENGMPVAFATIQVKGSNLATSSDANGMYHVAGVTIKDRLTITAAFYKTAEIPVTNTGNADVILTTMKGNFMGEVVMVGGISADDSYNSPVKPNHVAVIEVKDDITHQPLNARIIIKKESENKSAASKTNDKGIYKLRRIQETEIYTVTISAAGYRDTVLNLKGWHFNERKESRYIFLKKENIVAVPEKQRSIRMGGVSSISSEPLYVIDGAIADRRSIYNLKPDEIKSINVLKDAAAGAIYGLRG